MTSIHSSNRFRSFLRSALRTGLFVWLGLLFISGLLAPRRAVAEGTWVNVQQKVPGGIGTMLLLSDGTVMAQGGANQATNTWYRLTPDSTGGYINGTWTTRASMNYNRLFYTSVVLRDGRVFCAGAEYGNGTTNAEVYNPYSDSWAKIPVPSGLIYIDNTNYPNGENSAGFSDCGAVILSNGNVLVAPVHPVTYGGTVLFNASSNTLSLGPTINHGYYFDESSLVKLPDDSILAFDSFTTTSERYIPALNRWIADASAPVDLFDPYGDEMGAAFLLPNGKAFFLGSTPNTAIYTPTGTTNSGSWTNGPTIPNNLGAPDAPAAMMANGKILCAFAQTPYNTNPSTIFIPPTYFYEFDYNNHSASPSGTFTQVHAPNGSLFDPDGPGGGSPYSSRMLDLPDGTVLFTDSNTNGQLYVYIPDSTSLAAGMPAISSISSNTDGSFTLTGTGLNGISAGAAYGDDAQMDSNYPLVRFTDGSGKVHYGRTYNWSSTGVMTGTNIVSTQFTLPPYLPAGSYLEVVANGIASDSVAFYPSDHPTVNFFFPTNSEALSDSSAPQILGYADDTNATISVVRVALSRTSDGAWYDFVSGGWGTTTFDFNRSVLNASDVSGSHTGWLAQMPSLSAGNYTVQAESVNFFNNASSWKSIAFTIESPPVLTFSPFTDHQVVFNFDQLGGTINEMSTVQFKIEWVKSGGNQFWNGVNWTSVSSDPGVMLSANLSGLNWTPAPGTLPPRLQLAQANYIIHAYATNAAGDAGSNSLNLTRSLLDTTPPIVNLDNTSIHPGDVITNRFLPSIFGLAYDGESGVASVNVLLARSTGSGLLYWTGANWTSTPTNLPATYSTQDISWHLNVALPSGANLPNATYFLDVSAMNNEAPAGSGSLNLNFSVDYHPTYVFNYGSQFGLTPNMNWNDSANWDVGSVPTPDSIAVINGYSPNNVALGSVNLYRLDMSAGTLTTAGMLIQKLNYSGGLLSGGAITIATNGVCNWSGGTIGGLFTLSMGVVMNVSGAAPKDLADSAVFINWGSINWQGGGPLRGNGYGASSFVTNMPGASFQVSADGPLFGTINGQPLVFANAGGLFAKTAGAGTNSVDSCHFINTGMVRCDNGLLSFNAQLEFDAGGTIAGEATTRVAGGTLAIAGSTVISNGMLELAEGQFTGAGDGSGTFSTTGSGKLVWSGGSLNGTLNLAPNSHTEISGPGAKTFADGAILNNNGQVTWLSGTILGNGYSGPSYLRNRAGATYIVAGTNLASSINGQPSQFENQAGAILQVNISGESLWNGWQLINDGLLSGVAGRLNLAQGGAATSTFTNMPGAEVIFSGGTFLLHGGTRFNGAGTTRIAGATLTAGGPVTSANGNFLLDSGVLNGTGFASLGQFYWNGGTIGGIYSNGLGGAFTMTGSNDMVLADSAVFNNAGMARLTGTRPLLAYGYGDGATWNNLAGAFFDVSSDGEVFATINGRSLVFNNLAAARFAKIAGTNSILDSDVMNNLGELGCDSGTLTYNTTVNLEPGGKFTGAGRHAIIGGTVAWIGTNTLTNTIVSFSGGTVTGSSNAAIVTAGTSWFDWSGGTMAGMVALPSGSTIRLSGSGDKVLADSAVFNSAGTALLTGTGRLLAYGYGDVATWNNLAGAFFNVSSDGEVFATINGRSLVFNNLAAARFAKIAGTNSTVDSTILNNNGELGCDSGTLTYNTTVNLEPGGKFSGAGRHTIIGGTVAWIGTSTLTNTIVSFSGGTVTGSSNAAVVTAGTSWFDWSGGTMAGVVALPSGSTIRLSGSGDKVLADSAVFNSAGTALFTGTGRLLAYGYGDFATWNNLAGAFFNVSSDGEVFANIYGRSLIFNNLAAARFAKTAGANSTVDSTILNNNGELGCDSGTLTFNMVLNLNTGGTFTGIGNQVLGGGTVTLTGTSTVLSPVLSLAGASLIGGTGATLATAGGSLVDWSGGSLSGTLATAIGSKIRLSGSGSKGMADGAVLNNAGTVVFAGSGPLLANAYAAGATINNQPSGVIQALTNSTLGSIYGAGCFLTNAGSILLSSTPDLFQADWNYVQTSSGTMALVVAGTTAGTTYSRFAANSVTLDGSLAITLANGFSPTNGQSFDIATYGSESGQFALRHLPALPSNLAWQITYGATAVTLNVVRATTITDATRLANGHFQFSLSGPSATSALIQASTNLVNWTSLQTNTPFTGLLLFDDAQAVGYRVRFYRVIMQP